MKALQVFNGVEAAWWFLLAGIVVYRARVDTSRQRRWTAALAVWLVLFGISDVIEISTGAFWRPWWLLVWKGCCVVGVFGCTMILWRLWLKSRESSTSPP